MKSQLIEDIRKQFHNEWLLIAVDELDPETGSPLRGHLLGHNPVADELWEESRNHPEAVMVLYSSDWPDDLAACFVIHS